MDSSKYYFVKRKGDQAYPMVNILNMSQVELGNTDILQVEIGDPVPRKPVMADYLSSAKDIFSKRIADVMQAMNMEGVRFIPARVNTIGTVYDNYVCVVVDDNTYEALDKEKSDYDYSNGRYHIEKLILDREVLNQIPLSKRLGFRLREYAGYYLYHQSVVDAVMAQNPTGMYFQDIEEYEF